MTEQACLALCVPPVQQPAQDTRVHTPASSAKGHQCLLEDGTSAEHQALHCLRAQFKFKGTATDQPGRKRPQQVCGLQVYGLHPPSLTGLHHALRTRPRNRKPWVLQQAVPQPTAEKSFSSATLKSPQDHCAEEGGAVSPNPASLGMTCPSQARRAPTAFPSPLFLLVLSAAVLPLQSEQETRRWSSWLL